MRSDPSDNGGLFVGRRPGTAPVHYRTLPERAGSPARTVRRLDGQPDAGRHDAAQPALLGPDPDRLPLARLTGQLPLRGASASASWSPSAALFALLFGTLALLKSLDNAWILVRRAAGHDQRTGALGRIFAATAVVCGAAFAFWFLVIHGPGSSSFSGQPGS